MYPGCQNAALDEEDENHQLIPGTWRHGADMQDMNSIVGGSRTTQGQLLKNTIGQRSVFVVIPC